MAKQHRKLTAEILGLQIGILGIAFTFLMAAIPSMIAWTGITWVRDLFSQYIIPIFYLCAGSYLMFAVWKMNKKLES